MISALARAWLSLLFLAMALLLLWLTFSLSPTAQLVPRVVAIPTVVLLLVQCFIDLVPRLSAFAARYERLHLPTVESLRARAGTLRTRSDSVVSVLLWFAAAPAAVYLLGFGIGTPVYTVAFLRFRAREGWFKSLAIGAVLTCILWALLMLAVGRPITDGLLFDLLYHD